ncbi:MAG: DNA alkylation repair protein [Calditrichaeota bacterium]|nr:MAG: DNA alkylation repair protein [Calditrichota bacterium]
MNFPIIQYIRNALNDAADFNKAKSMAAYMKTLQKFYGVQAAPRRKICREALNEFPINSPDAWNKIVLILWRGESREEMYLALDIVERYKKYHDENAWPLFELLTRTATNWDTLDWIASQFVGGLVAQNRAFEAKIISWRRDSNFWVRRASLLVHLNHKKETNIALLNDTILCLADESEFFIRKAIGWVLREYAKTDPVWVKNFVQKNEVKLSGLSKREALKNLI